MIRSILLTGFIAGIVTLYLPWWMVAVICFLEALFIPQRPGRSFITGFLSVAILWLVYALYRDIPNEHILSTRMSQLFGLPHYSLYILAVLLIGGIVGGLAAWSGALLNRAIKA